MRNTDFPTFSLGVLVAAVLVLTGCATAKQEPMAAEPAPAAAPAPAPQDSDGDGVFDDQDECPGTPPGVRVDSRGCEIVLELIGPHFDFDSADLTDAGKAALDSILSRLQFHTTKQVEIIGHTDSTGPEEYNMGLSERRAQSVADYLAGNGVISSRITVRGMGETQPRADNSTKEGRAANRRVEVIDLGS